MRFLAQPADKHFDLVRSFQVFNDPTRDGTVNCLKGEYKGRPVTICDYSCGWNTPGGQVIAAQTTIVFENAVPDIPNLIIFPKGMIDKIADAVGVPGKAIKVPKAEKFNKKFGLYSEQGVKVAACVSPKLANLCIDEGKVVLEANEGNLLIYWPETYLAATDLDDRLAGADEMAQALEGVE
jgi:hypothetical protein